MAVGSFRDLERSYFDLRWHLDPVAATAAGLTDHDHRFGRFGPAALPPHLAALKSMATALEEATVVDLHEEIDRTALLDEIRVTIHRFERERPQARNPEFWLTHLFEGLHGLVRRPGADSAATATAVIQRLEDVPGLLQDARAALTDPVPLFAATALQVLPGGEALIREIRSHYEGRDPGESRAERLGAAADAAVAALQAFARDVGLWLDETPGAFALGEESFNFLLHYEHALRETAPELWRYGLHLQAEVTADLERLARELGGDDWSTLVRRLRQDHPSSDGLVAAYDAGMQRARRFVERHDLAPIPSAPLRVIPTPEFMRPLLPFAAYERSGPYATDQTGLFYVTLPDRGLKARQQAELLEDHCTHGIAGTALHEGYPGHHLQLVHAQRLPGHTRKNIWTPLTVEGWALYCEEMMGEQGFYDTPEERLFQRMGLLWRAVRILLDVGLHTRGMTIDEAVRRLVDGVHLDRANAESEVRRYCATPGYQLCYAVGRRELLRLRDDARAAQGPAFTLRGFHETVLSYGGLPVTLMRWGMGLDE